MKKETIIWILVAVLFVGQAVLFTMQCSKRHSYSGACSYKAKKYSCGHSHKKFLNDICSSCQTKIIDKYNLKKESSK